MDLLVMMVLLGMVSGATTGGAIDPNAFGDVVYLEGVSGIDAVNFERFQVGREGENSLKISATVTAQGVDENGNTVEVHLMLERLRIFKQFDAMTDRFAIETLRSVPRMVRVSTGV